jgi:hypothetical protein
VGKGGMQQNLDFKYGAGQKKWRVGGYLKKTRIITVKKRCQWEKATYCVMLMIKLNRCIYLFGCGCVPSATKSFFFFFFFFFSVREKRVFSLQHMRNSCSILMIFLPTEAYVVFCVYFKIFF